MILSLSTLGCMYLLIVDRHSRQPTARQGVCNSLSQVEPKIGEFENRDALAAFT